MQNKIIKLLIFVLIMVTQTANAQKEAYKLYIDLGIKYTPVEYLGGPVFGISLDNQNKKIGFNLRSDYIFSVGQKEQPVSEYIINSFNTYTYFDISYKFSDIFFVSLGAGWIYGGIGDNIMFNKDSGYPSGTISFKYTFDWITVELRGDIPLEDWDPIFDRGHLFPLSVACYYHFKPKKNEP
jgi:hypothetical protein